MHELEESFQDEQQDYNMTDYHLSWLASSKAKAESLQSNKEAYYQSLYEDIQLSKVYFGDVLTEDGGKNPSVESQAIEIIFKKSAYDKRIHSLLDRYERWNGFLHSHFTPEQVELLKRYYEAKEPIPYHDIERLNKRAVQLLSRMETLTGMVKEKEAMEQFGEYQRRIRDER